MAQTHSRDDCGSQAAPVVYAPDWGEEVGRRPLSHASPDQSGGPTQIVLWGGVLGNGHQIRTDAPNIRPSDEHSSEVGDGIGQIHIYGCSFGGGRYHASEASNPSKALQVHGLQPSL